MNTTADNITFVLAHYCEQTCQRTEYYLLKLFHETLTDPQEGTKRMVADIATILYSFENPGESYYKYTN